jgi:hypothetical protein
MKNHLKILQSETVEEIMKVTTAIPNNLKENFGSALTVGNNAAIYG